MNDILIQSWQVTKEYLKTTGRGESIPTFLIGRVEVSADVRILRALDRATINIELCAEAGSALCEALDAVEALIIERALALGLSNGRGTFVERSVL